jgi:hypothetical protein
MFAAVTRDDSRQTQAGDPQPGEESLDRGGNPPGGGFMAANRMPNFKNGHWHAMPRTPFHIFASMTSLRHGLLLRTSL